NLRAIAPVGRIFEVIIFTGNAERDDVIDALRAGVADYFQKPLNLDQLLDGLSRVMSKLEKRSAESRIKMLSHNLQVLSSSLSEICNGIGISLPHGPEGLGPLPPALAPAASLAPAAAPEADAFLMPDAGPTGNKLSPRQKDVAALIAQGFTNYQIACELGISENTVKIYVSQVLRIFNISNRTQLALALARSGRDELLQSKPDSDSEPKKRRAGT
ncbi:MAG: LuxR C-terminal-related transcriptional regulator, partial [Porticoccaceae bacterium]|nr:LuxR C-terminal-related transcriptional regulator [Porticoccaceae bacterium]